MSERVVPTKPGWWFVRYRFHQKCPNDIADVYLTADGLEARFRGGRHAIVCSEDCEGFVEWLAPVPSSEAVAAAVEALKAAAAEFHEYEWATSLKVQMDNAIAGLTGEGV